MTNENSARGYTCAGHKLKSSTYKIAVSTASFGEFLELHFALSFAPDSLSFVTMDLFPDSTRDLHRRMRWRRNRYNVEWRYSSGGFGVEHGERPTVVVYDDAPEPDLNGPIGQDSQFACFAGKRRVHPPEWPC